MFIVYHLTTYFGRNSDYHQGTSTRNLTKYNNTNSSTSKPSTRKGRSFQNNDQATRTLFSNWPFTLPTHHMTVPVERFTSYRTQALLPCSWPPTTRNTGHVQWIVFILIIHLKVKVKWSIYRPGVAQRVGRGIALLFHNCGTRRGWVVSSTLQSHFTPGKDPAPILREAGWTPGPVWTGGKARPHRDSIPDLPARSQSLYQLSYLNNTPSTHVITGNQPTRTLHTFNVFETLYPPYSQRYTIK